MTWVWGLFKIILIFLEHNRALFLTLIPKHQVWATERPLSISMNNSVWLENDGCVTHLHDEAFVMTSSALWDKLVLEASAFFVELHHRVFAAGRQNGTLSSHLHTYTIYILYTNIYSYIAFWTLCVCVCAPPVCWSCLRSVMCYCLNVWALRFFLPRQTFRLHSWSPGLCRSLWGIPSPEAPTPHVTKCKLDLRDMVKENFCLIYKDTNCKDISVVNISPSHILWKKSNIIWNTKSKWWTLFIKLLF